MPISYTIEPDGRLVTRADGLITFHDIHAHLDHEQRNRDLGRAELVDARGAIAELTPDQIRSLIQRAEDMLETVDLGPTAFVITNDVVFGMARMYTLLAERAGVNAQVFRDVPSATTWLASFDGRKP